MKMVNVNKIKYNSFRTAVFFMLTLAISACKKDNTSTPRSSTGLVKSFDFPINDLNGARFIMAAGVDHYYLVYQTGLAWPVNNIQTVLLTTDASGNILSRDSWPIGILPGDITVCRDGSVLATGYSDGSPQFFLSRYGKSGDTMYCKYIQIDGIDMGNIFEVPQLTPLPNGNVLVSGNYYQSVGGSPLGYLAEMDLQGNIIKAHSPGVMMHSFVYVPGAGGLILNWQQNWRTGQIDVYLSKTNVDGDTVLWTKKLNRKPLFGENFKTSNFSSTSRKTFRFAYPSMTDQVIWEINENGDSLNYKIVQNAVNGSLVSHTGDRTIFSQPSTVFINGNGVMVKGGTTLIMLDQLLNVSERISFQHATSDHISPVVSDSRGRIAGFGVTQPFRNAYYKPILITLNK